MIRNEHPAPAVCRRLSRFVFLAAALLGLCLPGPAQDEGALLEEERLEIDLMRRRGELDEALAFLAEVLADVPDDFQALVLRAKCRFERCAYDEAVADARRAVELSAAASDADRAAAVRALAEILIELGRSDEALTLLEKHAAVLRPARDARDAWWWARALHEAGRGDQARSLLQQGTEAGEVMTWPALLARARCLHALGDIEAAAEVLVAADRVAAATDGSEPDLLTALGELYFEAYGEVDDARSRNHSPVELYREALTLHPDHEGARLGMFALYRFNWQLSRMSPEEIMNRIFAARPQSIRGLVVRVSASLDNGALPAARRDLATLADLAGGRRDVRIEQAALAWVEHRRDEAQAILDDLLAGSAQDAEPERRVGRHLLELYRFAEALPFLARAVERDPGDWRAWRDLGRAQANTGDEEAARASLAQAKETAEGRRDAWRDNTLLVLNRIADRHEEHEAHELTFTWQPDAAEILGTYLVPFYEDAREELSARYGYTPDPVRIEVFRRWADFSVRSTGFEGFPALGVCFGPVVTAVSPLAEGPRGQFSWARTSYHEFTHVIHLGLSHNRCPRWVTEGLATWEESNKNPAWRRNLRRDLVNARANGAIIPIRKLNNAFRGPRVLFAYYQSGLVCEMLIEQHGFPPIVRLLEAFDRGADLDGALNDVFGVTPEQLEEQLLARIDEIIAPLKIEPQWSADRAFRLGFRLSKTPPADPAERARWANDWCTVAWGTYWGGKQVDAEEALRTASLGGDLPPRGLFLRAELLLGREERTAARKVYEQAFNAGGEDFRARVAFGGLLQGVGDFAAAEAQLLAAEQDFPAFPDPDLAAETRLASLYRQQGRTEDEMAARMRWLKFNAGEYELRTTVASWLGGEERHDEAVRYFEEANEVDPFRRTLHLRWGQSLRALGRLEEAVREFSVALAVPVELDGDLRVAGEDGIHPDLARAWNGLEPTIRGLLAQTLAELGRTEEARAEAERALALDGDCEPAKEALSLLDG